MSCNCGGSAYTRILPDEERAEKIQLGPAYEAYKAGEVDVPSRWRPNKSLEDWVPECCAELAPDWKMDDMWEVHTIMMACFYATSTILLGLFLYFRNEQPLKFRDYRSVILFWFLLNAEMTVAVMMGNMGGTGPSVIHLILPFSLPCAVLAYYIVKSVQVFYIYAWNQAKLNKKAYEKIKMFHAFRFVLDYRAYFVTLGVLLVFLCVVPVTYSMLARPVFADANGENAFNTLRCEWWQIPEEYQQKQSNSTLCVCIEYATLLPGGTLEECTQAVTDVCVKHVNVDPADAGFCSTCLTDFATQKIGTECNNWLADFYAAGNCGHPPQVPNTITCRTGIFADKFMGDVSAGISYFLLSVNLLVAVPLLGKRDDFGLILENILTTTVATIALFFAFAGILGDHATMFEWWYDGLGMDYRPVPMFTWIGIFWVMLMMLGFPLCLLAWRKAAPWIIAIQKRPTPLPRQPSSVPEVGSSVAATDGGPIVGDFLDEGEYAIELCVRHPPLREIYSKFAVEAFHVENIRFLEDCAAWLSRAAGELTTETLSTMADRAQTIYEQYITADAPLEVNIPARRRTQVKDNLNAFLERVRANSPIVEAANDGTSKGELEMSAKHRRGSSTVVCQTLPEVEAIAASFAEAYSDIRRLLGRDCWPRFKLSRFYPAYKQLIEEEAELTIAVSGIIKSDTPTTERHVSETPTPTDSAMLRGRRELSSAADSLDFDSEKSWM